MARYPKRAVVANKRPRYKGRFIPNSGGPKISANTNNDAKNEVRVVLFIGHRSCCRCEVVVQSAGTRLGFQGQKCVLSSEFESARLRRPEIPTRDAEKRSPIVLAGG